MKNAIQKEPEMQKLRREKSYRSASENETNEQSSFFIEGPDTVPALIVLLLACIWLTVLAHIVA